MTLKDKMIELLTWIGGAVALVLLLALCSIDKVSSKKRSVSAPGIQDSCYSFEQQPCGLNISDCESGAEYKCVTNAVVGRVMYKFIKIKDKTNEYDHVDVQMVVKNTDATWTDLMDVFVSFLRGCGYVIGEGHFVQDSALDEYINTQTQTSMNVLIELAANAGRLNELLVHPDPFIRELAEKAFKAGKGES